MMNSFICAVTEARRFKLAFSSAKSSGAWQTDKLLNPDIGPESDPEPRTVLPVAVLHIVAVTAADNPKRVCNKTITTESLVECVRVWVRACEIAGASSGARLRSMNSGKLHIVKQENTLVLLLYKIKAQAIVLRIVLVKY